MSDLLSKFEDAVYITSEFPYPNIANEYDTVKFEIRKTAEDYISSSETVFTPAKEGDYVPKEKDKLFFYPGCDVPRHKVRDWAADKKISITIKEENATVKFGSNKSVKACINVGVHNYFQLYRDRFIKWLHFNYTSQGDTRFDDLIKTLDNSNHDYLYIKKDLLPYNIAGYGWRAEKHESLKSMMNHEAVIASTWTRPDYVTDSNWSKLTNLLSDDNVYPQEKILSLISDNSADIDAEMYEQLRTMLNSTTKEDKVIALEIMANCNFDSSVHHLLLLCKEFAYDLLSLKESKHVNFTSLLKYLDVGDIRYLNEDTMVECLMEKDALTMDILKEICDGVKNIWAKSNNTKYFEVNSITVSNEVKNYFKQKEQASINQEQPTTTEV